MIFKINTVCEPPVALTLPEVEKRVAKLAGARRYVSVSLYEMWPLMTHTPRKFADMHDNKNEYERKKRAAEANIIQSITYLTFFTFAAIFFFYVPVSMFPGMAISAFATLAVHVIAHSRY